MCRSKKILLPARQEIAGISLPEVMAGLVILALVCSTVLVVIERSMAGAADLAERMRAFEVARDNMEKLLFLDSVKESVEYGTSEKYPEIQWQTVIETFYEPVTSKMWVQAICSAEYGAELGEAKKVELTHWLTDLTDEQVRQIEDARTEREQRLAEQGEIIETIEEAAEYAGVGADTIEQWEKNGMRKTGRGYYTRSELDLYKRTNGKPTIWDRIETGSYEPSAEQLDELLEYDELEANSPGKGQ